jgi:hypothetical protein
MRTPGALSNPTYIALPAKPRPTKCDNQVLRDSTQPLRTGQKCVLLAKSARELAFGLLVEFGFLQQRGQLSLEIFVDELQLGDAVLIKQWDGCTVLDRKL